MNNFPMVMREETVHILHPQNTLHVIFSTSQLQTYTNTQNIYYLPTYNINVDICASTNTIKTNKTIKPHTILLQKVVLNRNPKGASEFQPLICLLLRLVVLQWVCQMTVK